MRNRIIAVYRIPNRLVSITVENPDFSELRVNQFVKIGDKEYRINSLPFMDSTPPKSFFEMDTFAIDYTEDELMNKVAELLLRPHHYHSRLQVSHPLRLPILQLLQREMLPQQRIKLSLTTPLSVCVQNYIYILIHIC